VRHLEYNQALLHIAGWYHCKHTLWQSCHLECACHVDSSKLDPGPSMCVFMPQSLLLRSSRADAMMASLHTATHTTAHPRYR
jgi:hypothetical protein